MLAWSFIPAQVTNPDWRQLPSVGIRFSSCGATANTPSRPGRITMFLYMFEMKELSFWKALPWRISCQNVCHSKVWSTEDSLTKWANMRSLTYVRDDKQCHSDDHREEESLPQAIITWDSSYTPRNDRTRKFLTLGLWPRFGMTNTTSTAQKGDEPLLNKSQSVIKLSLMRL